MLEQIKPMDIERRSFEIITELLGERRLDPENELVIKRAIHTTADFDYADNLVFSDHAVTKGIEALRAGCDIVTDTQMAKAGINKTILASLGGEVHCFMSDPDVAAEAKARGVTRAIVSMERAAQLPKPCIFAIGNAPTALVSLETLMEADKLHPALIIGVPVGFVNVIESKSSRTAARPISSRAGARAAAMSPPRSATRCSTRSGAEMEEYVIKDGKKLRLGYTTGSCAAAAAKAAAWMLLTGHEKRTIDLLTPKGVSLTLDVLEITRTPDTVSCAIRKDSGDDPDVTHDTLVFAAVQRMETPGVTIDGGAGVGRVTKRGLDQPVGAAAINSVPRRMIRENVEEVLRLCDYRGGLAVMISVPEGEALAKKTFNPRLGIVGGISILGTTGIVEPMSEQALVDTIHVELRQRRANGADYVLLTPGNYGADFIRASIGLDPRTAVLTSNFIGDALEHCRALGFRGALLVGHIGKLVKLAGGMWNTHSKCGDCRMELIAAHAAALGLPPARVEEVLDCATCDDALRILKEEQLYDAVLARLAERIEFHLAHKCGEMAAGAIVFSKEYGLLCRTSRAQELLGTIMEG